MTITMTGRWTILFDVTHSRRQPHNRVLLTALNWKDRVQAGQFKQCLNRIPQTKQADVAAFAAAFLQAVYKDGQAARVDELHFVHVECNTGLFLVKKFV